MRGTSASGSVRSRGWRDAHPPGLSRGEMRGAPTRGWSPGGTSHQTRHAAILNSTCVTQRPWGNTVRSETVRGMWRTWPAKGDSGWQTGSTGATTAGRLPRTPRGRLSGTVGWCAAGRGIAIPASCAAPIATGSIQMVRATTPDFVASEALNRPPALFPVLTASFLVQGVRQTELTERRA